MVGEDGVADTWSMLTCVLILLGGYALTDVPSDSFVEASVSKDSECCGEMLLPVQSLLFQAIELWGCPDLKLLASSRAAESA